MQRRAAQYPQQSRRNILGRVPDHKIGAYLAMSQRKIVRFRSSRLLCQSLRCPYYSALACDAASALTMVSTHAYNEDRSHKAMACAATFHLIEEVRIGASSPVSLIAQQGP